MKITLSSSAGFCPGVRVAARRVEELIDKRRDGEVIVTLGNLIHNPTYVNSLYERGVRSVDVNDIEALASKPNTKKIYVVIRTHGITKETEAWLSFRSLNKSQLPN